MYWFLSDNTAKVHENVLRKMAEVNENYATPYGYDEVTVLAKKMISDLFGGAYVRFVLTGTGANILSISSIIRSYEAVICADSSHLNVDECGAFEKMVGGKLYTVPHKNGKISKESICHLLQNIGNEHHNQPRVISISQLTEYGTAYTEEEIADLADFAHKNDMYLHVDGARIANAVLSKNSSFRAMIKDTGVDLFSFGCAKNGLMYGEAIVCFDEKIYNDLKFIRKQSTQLMSKMRYISAQYIAILEDDLWKKNASNSNEMMKLLVDGIRDLPYINIDFEPEGNILFMTLDKKIVRKMQDFAKFYAFIDLGDKYVTRFVTSFDTKRKDVEKFVELIRKVEMV